MKLLAFGKLRPARTHINLPGIAKIARRLQNLTFLPIVQRKSLHVIKRKLTEINLAVLRITQRHTIIHHTRMISTHRAYIHRLYAPYPAIILHLHAGEIAQRVGHRITVKPLQLIARERLHRNHILLYTPAHNHHLLQIYAVGHGAESAQTGV